MAHLVLFEHRNFRGAEKHLFRSEDNLNAPDDNFFNDRTSSFVIIDGTWQFFRDWHFENPASNPFGPGLYDWVENHGIPNDSISSVRLL